MEYDGYFILFFLLFVAINASIKTYKFERQRGSTIILPACLSTSSSSLDKVTTILFKSDSGELLSMNGILVSRNPRFMLRNAHSTELIIKSIESTDEGQYECRTDQTIHYICHLMVVNSSTIHLTALEGSNITLQCLENGMWIIEESHRGGPVRTQYTKELILTNIQRSDHRFHTIVCSAFDGHEKREYIIDVLYKPTVKLLMSTDQRLMCIICAHPLPHRIQWRWNAQKERDDTIHQTNINQSCIAQQFTVILEKPDDIEQNITCEAENIFGIDRDSLQLKEESMARSLTYITQKLSVTSSSALLTSTTLGTNESSSIYSIMKLLYIVHLLMTISVIDMMCQSTRLFM